MSLPVSNKALALGSNPNEVSNTGGSRRLKSALLASLGFAALLTLFLPGFPTPFGSSNSLVSVSSQKDSIPSCPQSSLLSPPSDEHLDSNLEYFGSPSFIQKSARLLSGLVQIPSESYDDEGPVGVDSRWDVFYKMSSYLETSFPLVHSNLERRKINTHGLLYKWQGSDTSLKPMLFMAHQDVVPVDPSTEDEWKYPPYSGHFDGEMVWGRGACDCKTTLVQSLQAVEELLEKGFKPERTLLLSYGFDEESKGYEGAGNLAAAIEDEFGKNGVYAILDEGSGIADVYGTPMALIDTAEKGYLDVNITLRTKGGHSSVPPQHTNIGILSSIVTSIETLMESSPVTSLDVADDDYMGGTSICHRLASFLGLQKPSSPSSSAPFSPRLSRKNPYYETLQCAASHGESIPSSLKSLIHSSLTSDLSRRILAKKVARSDPEKRFLIQTSLATTLIRGGVKVNALPEFSWTVVNFRISVDESTESVKKVVGDVLQAKAEEFGLALRLWGQDVDLEGTGKRGLLDVKGIGPLEPAPVSPLDAESWEILSGTIRHAFRGRFGSKEIVVSPSIMSGNTDTQFYWRDGRNLTTNIYRFIPARDTDCDGVHTVNERVRIKGHVDGVWFYHELIRNVQPRQAAAGVAGA